MFLLHALLAAQYKTTYFLKLFYWLTYFETQGSVARVDEVDRIHQKITPQSRKERKVKGGCETLVDTAIKDNCFNPH